jgi:2,5-diketo-D-gluconate reductase A
MRLQAHSVHEEADIDRNSHIRLRTGSEMPVLGLGTWQLKNDTAGTIAAALEAGYPMIDTSGDYGTQPGIGAGIRRSGVDRSGFYLVTKVEETDDATRRPGRTSTSSSSTTPTSC